MIAPLCIGRDALEAEQLTFDLQRKLHIFGRGGPVTFGISGIDIALWDIAGKAAGRPVHALLGGNSVQALDCYASLIRYGDSAIVQRNVERAMSQGFRYVKLHEIEYDYIRAAREAAGKDVGIMVDVNCPWSVSEASSMAHRLRSLELYWLEEPVWPPEDFAGLATVRSTGAVRIAAGENAASVTHYQQMIAAGAVDFLQPSPTKMGGISELRKVFALAKERGVTVMPHSFYDGPGFLAAVHAIAALGQQPLVEWRYFDLEDRLYADQGVPVRGAIPVPQAPGLGLDPDPAVIARYRAE
jgi:L-alanine-DL-glutamate epimerase-like enolase superfamily enzyme